MKPNLMLIVGLAIASPFFLAGCAVWHACRDGLCR